MSLELLSNAGQRVNEGLPIGGRVIVDRAARERKGLAFCNALQRGQERRRLIELEQSPAAVLGYDRTRLESHHSSAFEKALAILDTVPYLRSCFEGSISAEAPLKTVDSYFDMVRDRA